MKETLKAAIKHFGVPNQLDMVIEECAELIQAINKAKRAGIVKEWGISHPSKESTMSEIEAYNNLVSEFSDNKIMLGQLDLMLQKDFTELSTLRKLNRLKTKLQNGN